MRGIANRRISLAALAQFRPIFEQENFCFAAWHQPPVKDGMLVMGYFDLSPDARRFLTVCYEAGWVWGPPFHWISWTGSDDAQALKQPERIASAAPDLLAKLLTVCIRSDRFNEGALFAAFKAGVLTAIVRRAEVLLQVEGEEEPTREEIAVRPAPLS